MNSFENCCCCDVHANNCVICGKPLIYSTETVMVFSSSSSSRQITSYSSY